MLITEKETISQADYNELTNGTDDKIREYVGWRARFSAYPPAGYGFINPRVFKEDNQYYCSWKHSNNSD